MTYEDFIKYVRQPHVLNELHHDELKELVQQYPYLDIAKWLYLKSLYNSKNIYFGQELKKTALYASDRRNLYFFIHPDELSTATTRAERAGNVSGSYFDMMDTIENNGTNNKKSLQALAEKLKAARLQLQNNAAETEGGITVETKEKQFAVDPITPPSDTEKSTPESHVDFTRSELLVKQYVKEKKYEAAIVILDELNLINPKKSVYFADQIRFLKKIIEKQ